MIEFFSPDDLLFTDAVLHPNEDFDSSDPSFDLPKVQEVALDEVFAPDLLASSASELDFEPELDPFSEHLVYASKAGVVVRSVETHLDVAAAVQVLDEVFAPTAGHFYPPSLLRNILAAGGPIAVAWEKDEPLGVILSLPSWGADGPFLQSGPMGVVSGARGRGLATALKSFQRAWCLERNVSQVRWTFDLMVAVTARLNLHTLRAEAVEFLPGYEGVRPLGLGPELPNDRLLVRWDLTKPTGLKSIRHRVLTAQGEVPWAVKNVDNKPFVAKDWLKFPLFKVALPFDIVSLRQDDPTLAAFWQQAVGGVLKASLAKDYSVSVDASGAYIVAKKV